MSGMFKKILDAFRAKKKHPVHEVLKQDLHQEAMAIVQKRMDNEKRRKAELKAIRYKLENGIPLNEKECKRIKVLKIKDKPTSYQ
jgi:FMN-dependent NADH-azoreductase